MEKKIKYEKSGFPFFMGIDWNAQTVTCNPPNNKPDKEDGKV